MRFYTHIAGGILLFVILVWIFSLPLSLIGLIVVSLVSVIPDLIDRVVGEYRGWGHSAILLIPIFFSFFLSFGFGISLFSGFIMHIIFDVITRKGVPFLFPFSPTRLVMPKREKSRIITGSKQEIALFIVVLLLLIPVAYAVVHGVDLGSSNTNKTNKTLNKTGKGTTNNTLNKTGNNTSSSLLNYLKKLASSNLRSSSSYSPSKSSSNSNSSNSEDNDLINWLQNNTPSQDNSNSSNSSNSSIVDNLINSISSNYNNLAEGQTIESPFAMNDSDDSGFSFFDGFNSNPDSEDNPDDWSGDNE